MEILFILGALALPFALPIASWVSARRTRALVEALEASVAEQGRTIDALKSQVAHLRRDLRDAAPPAPKPEAPKPEIPKPEVPKPEIPKPAIPKPELPKPAIPKPEIPKPEAPKPEVPFDWENLVGVKLFSAIAGIALVLAAVFFLRYSIEHGWLQPPVRVLIGIVVALGLLIACEFKAARKYPATANAMDAAAIAILFATFFAAHALWRLIPAPVAFGLLGVVTALAVLLSIRRESLFIAVLGLLGGFATPVLLSTGENRPVPLFAYLLLLNVGLAWVAYKKTWPALTVLTLVFTTIYQWGWVLRFLRDASDVSLAMGIFLVFPLVTFAGVLLSRRPALADADTPADTTFERTALAAALVPLAFGVFLAAVPAYGARASLLFGFLLLLDVGMLAIALARRQPVLHAIAAGTTLLAMAVWLGVSYVSDARIVTLLFTGAFVVLYLGAPVAAAWFGRPFEREGRIAEYAAPSLLFVFPALARLEPAFAAPWWLFLTLLAVLVLCGWRAVATGRGYLYYIAAFFAVAAQSVWTVEHLDLERLRTAVSIYAVFGVVALAVPSIARRRARPLSPEGGGGLVLLVSLFLLLYLSSGALAPAALWALALLLAILNAGLFVESAGARLPALSITGSVLSWMILGIWWMRAAGSVGVLPSLSVLVGLTLLTLGGHAWARATMPGEDDGSATTHAAAATRALMTTGLFVGLGGHLFLVFLALNREWSLPPWPLFGALAVMTLAISTAALHARAPVLHAAGVTAAAIVAGAWATAAAAAPWPAVGLVASAAVSVYALGWIPLFRRAGDHEIAPSGAAAALFAGEVTAMIAGAHDGRPPLLAFIVSHVVTLSVLLSLTWARRWRYLAVVAALTAWMAAAAWTGTWQEALALSASLYLVFAAFPLVLGSRVGGDRDPFLAAIVASAMFFFIGRGALDAGGYDSIVGVLPVVEALVLAVLLRQLLRIEAAGSRDLGRLALVAGAALGFVTIAIPVQLDHQWMTIGWALEGAALAWLFTRIPHRGLLYSALALLAVVFVRLALNPEVFHYEPRGELRIFNWYLYTYLTAAVSMLLAAWWTSRTEDQVFGVRASQILPAGAVILLFLLLNIEIADYYATGPEITFRFGAGVSQDLTYTIGWLLFGMALLAAGIYVRSRPARVTAVTLIAITAFKCFLYDLGELGGLYRVASFVGLAVALALVSLALQKYVLSKPKDPEHAPASL